METNAIPMMLAAVMLATAAFGADPARKAANLVAHRGESYEAPENTLASVRLAWAQGADSVEIDVYLTSDGRLAVCHDANTKRTAGVDRVIRNTTLDNLRKLDVGRWKGEKWAGEKIPTIEEILATIPDGKRLLVEIKAGPEAVGPVVQAIQASGKRPAQVTIISFSAAVVEQAKRSLPEYRTSFISDFRQDKETKKWSPTAQSLIATAQRIKADGISVSAKEPLDAEFVRTVKAAGLELNTWTIDTPDAARQMLDLGVDSVTTNRAAWMKAQLER